MCWPKVCAQLLCEADASGFAPLDKGEKVQALKPNRLLLHEARKGLVAEVQPPLAGAGKATFEKSMNAALDALQTGSTLPPAKRQRTDAAPKPKTEPKPKNPAPAPPAPPALVPPASKAAPPEKPAESVADLLKAWGK